ncbi:MAG: four helix bundle protein [Saprospiraceae bacterium]|jgi:four helix bundle protein
MNSNLYNQVFRDRTKKFAIDIITLLSEIKYSDAFGILKKQSIRSATSVAANYRASCRARSLREKYSKLCIVVEECDETQFWLELLLEANFLPKENFETIYQECSEILMVMSSFRKKIGIQLNNT